MNLQTVLYFCSILLTFLLTGFLAQYTWRQPALPGARTFAWMVLSECLLALTEILSMLGGAQAHVMFWFNLRTLFIAVIPVLWLKFALEYSGRKDWLAKRLLAGMFIVPLLTQAILWSNSLHGLWVRQEVAFRQAGPLWIAATSARIPGLWFMVHSFYSMILILAGIGVILLTAWQKREDFRAQAVLLSVGALISLAATVIPTFNLLPQSEFNPFVPGVGVSVLMYALAMFRFQFLKRAPAQESTLRLTTLEPHEKKSLAVLIFIFILLASSIAAASYFTYQNYERQFRVQVESQLSAIATLKADELQDWRSERLADASLFYHNENFSERVQTYLENPQDAETRLKLLTWMEKIKASPECDRVFLLDSHGVERLSIPAAPEAVPPNLVEQASASLDGDQVAFLDFHRHSDSDGIHLSILVPVFDPQNNQPLGTLVLRINPEIYLYPFIWRWPVPSQSAETLIIRRDGNDILYLNELKFKQDAALNLRIPLENEGMPAVKAVLGQTGIVTGMDYRGTQIIADIRAVPNTPWFLVSKIDTAEVYAPLRERLWQTFFFFGALILLISAGLMLIWRQQRIHFYRGQVKVAEALRLSEEKFRLAFDTSPDSVAITRMSDGMFVSVNKGFEKISGYAREQAIGKTSTEINIWKDPQDRRNVIEELQATGKVRNYEAPFLALDGEIYGLISAVIIELNGEPHILNIVRDITERKRAEEALRQSETNLSALIENTDGSIWAVDKQYGLIVGNREFHRNTSAALGRRLEMGESVLLPSFPPKVNAEWQGLYDRALQGESFTFETLTRFRESPHYIEYHFSPIREDSEEIRGVTVYGRDITERKQAEDALIQVNDRLALAQRLAGAGIWDWDLATGKLNWTPEFFHLFGLDPTKADSTFDTWRGALHPNDVQSAEQHINEAIRDHVPLFNEYRIVTPSGETRWIGAWGDATYNERGEAQRMTGLCIDITERKQADKKLKESNSDLKRSQSVAHLGNWKWNLKTSTVEWSDEMFHIFGVDKDSYSGRLGDVIAKVLHPDDLHIVLPSNASEFAKNKPQEYRIVRPNDGEIRHIWAQAGESILDEQGNPAFLTGIAQDITERKCAEDAMRASEEKFRQAFNTSPIAISIARLEGGRFVSVNKSFEQMSGYSESEVIGKTAEELHLWKSSEVHQSLLEELRGKGEVRDYETPFLTRNGEVYCLTSASTIEIDGEPHILTLAVDITERKQAEEKLTASEVRYRRLFEAARDGILILDAGTGMIVDVNPFLVELLGFSYEVFLGKKLWEIGFFKDIAASKENFLELQQQEYIRYEDLPLETADGRRINVEFTSNVFHTDHFKVIQCNIRDITERKQAQEQLLKALDELKRSNTELEQFAYIASHDLQEPLRAVAGMVQLLQQRYSGQLDARADEYIGLAVEGATRMKTLINDLLAYSRVERRGSPIKLVDANAALQSALRNLETAITEGGAVITSDSLPTLDADATQLAQLFQNLIGNAIKFHGERPPEIHVRVEDIGDAWQFSVSDNGIGIEPQYYERIFLVFQRLHTRRDYSGTGIGLSICKKIVERHGGRIWIESTPGQGTTFHFTIPHRR